MAGFDYFVVLADMRTGSNFLEANINMFDALTCHGEAFNPHFIGYPQIDDILGVKQPLRDADPLVLIDRVKDAEGLNGFRFFNNHDPRALDMILPDPRCAKIVLTRNPIDSYVSWKIAAATGQWKLTNANHVKTEQVVFDPDEFERHMANLQAFQVRIQNVMQRTGQTAFYISYDDLHDVEIMNGMAMFLGIDDRITHLNKKLKKQNPAMMDSKVSNFPEMAEALAKMDRFNLNRTPNFEPRRGPMVPSYVAAPSSPLLHLPLKSGPNDVVQNWMKQLDDGADLITGFSQKSLRDWKNDRPGHRTFAVLRHPVAWAHTAFCERILSVGKGSFPEVRATLAKVHRLKLPDDPSDPAYDTDAHRAAFLSFLKFLRANLAAQTSMRVDPSWATQLSVLQGMSEFGLPDSILREQSLPQDLAVLASHVGKTTMPKVPDVTDPLFDRLLAIYDPSIEAAARDAYARDYLAFGFGNWVQAA